MSAGCEKKNYKDPCHLIDGINLEQELFASLGINEVLIYKEWAVHSCYAEGHKPFLIEILTLDTKGQRPGICVKYFLAFPQKNLSPEKTETN